MVSKGYSVLGVDINPNEICVVEMRGAWPNGQVLRADTIPMPPGALDNGRIANAEAVAGALRSLLERMGVETRESIMGIAARSVIARVIEVPRVPDSEMPVVIEGELTHYQILGAHKNSLDYLRLHEGSDGGASIPQVLVTAAEESVVNGYCAVADQAGLRLIALEPVLVAMYRAAFLQAQDQPAAITLTISDTEAEIAIADKGHIRLYRRVDIGSDHLILSRQPSGYDSPLEVANSYRLAFNAEEEEEPRMTGNVPPSRLSKEVDPESARALATEIRRSLDYYQSQFPDTALVRHTVVAIDHPALQSLVEWLGEELNLETSIARLPAVWKASPGLAARMEPPDDLPFIAATGLAMHGLTNLPAHLPSFDLSTRQRADLNVEYARRKLAISLTLSLAALIVGMVGAYKIGGNANRVNHDFFHAQEDLNEMQHKKQTNIDSIQAQANVLRVLQSQGYPLPRIMDAATHTIASQAGFIEISLNPAGHLHVTGEAANETAMIKTLEGFKNSPYFEDTVAESFGKAGDTTKPTLVKFQISSQLAGTKPAVTAAAKAP
jgi:type IV pilus assembly protein PilM